MSRSQTLASSIVRHRPGSRLLERRGAAGRTPGRAALAVDGAEEVDSDAGGVAMGASLQSTDEIKRQAEALPSAAALPTFLVGAGFDFEGPRGARLHSEVECRVGQVVGRDEEVVRLVLHQGPRARQIDHSVDDN